MADIDINRIANIIADIQTGQEKVTEGKAKVKELERELEEEKEYLDDSISDVRSLRDELDNYLDELIPEGNDRDNLLRGFGDDRY